MLFTCLWEESKYTSILMLMLKTVILSFFSKYKKYKSYSLDSFQELHQLTMTVLRFTAPIAFEFMCLPTPSRFDRFASKLLCSRLKSLPVHVFLSSPSSWTAHPSSTEDQRLRRRIPSLPQRRFLSSTTGKQKKTESSLPISIVCQQQINSDLLV